MGLKTANGGVSWKEWDPNVEADPDEIEFQRFLQTEFTRQWCALKRYANDRGIRIMGDVPIYVAMDSADVWAQPELFRFDVVSGVPPDYFSATGQLWGNPIYRWDRMEAEGYSWWVERMRTALETFDFVRMDHFRGFEAYWEVPASEETAEHGRWVKGPGARLFRALERGLGPLPIVAENLGVITPEVEAIREEFGFPGMAVLQFAFGRDPQGPSFQPHNYPRHLAAYTGTHDNDTVMGWWRSEGGDSIRTADDIAREKAKATAYLGAGDAPMNLVMIRELMRSVADTVVFPMQDVLGLGSEARMNTPSVASGNWRWRMTRAQWKGAPGLREMAELYGRVT
jgi:4-alpha-glucanotransferase